MTNSEAYNQWAENYDTVINKTRDVEAKALRHAFNFAIESTPSVSIGSVLEIGCGTGKNTQWFAQIAESVVGVDFSSEMLAKAKEKITDPHVNFLQADIQKPWAFDAASFDWVSFSLVLEHIEDLDFIFKEAHRVLKKGGKVYLGELHPFKQYQGSKARFDQADGSVFVLECFIHNVSDFFSAAQKHDFDCLALNEWFDELFDDLDNSTTLNDGLSPVKIPRILSMVFEKKTT